MPTTTDITGSISNQLTQISTTVSNSGISQTIRTKLLQSQTALQNALDTLILGSPLSDAQKAQLTSDLESSQKNVLAAKAEATRRSVIIILVVGVAVAVGLVIYLRHKKETA